MRFQAILLACATLAFVAGPFLVPQFGGFDPALYPYPQIDPPVQPAGYAFALWGVIYLWLLVHAGMSLFKRHDAQDWAPMRMPLFWSLLVGAGWLSVAEVSPVWAQLMIFIMLGFALIAMKRAPVLDPWLARAPVALYAGWLTAASFAGLGLLGAGYGMVLGELGWAYLCLIAAFALALWGRKLRPDAPFYTLGVAWALIAIAAKNWDHHWGLVGLASLGAFALVIMSLRAFKLEADLERPI
ncbi:hypothetical protein EDD53_0332 [Pacificibacter maritimus]|uniref:TspO/MBR related protein n=1 Tax=Pacificibacter maritimus TaxID=762213 RepID=A0A3N4UMH5_9RHOB|nr:hypothetical protein [Pacificibacter maritimus]RPE71218.1 hypothetical protein EDD53_0332 [Pacificibacter maritimus]